MRQCWSTLRRSLFGYSRSGVDGALEDVAESFEQVWRERADLVERLHALQAEIDRHRGLEDMLRKTLVTAEQPREGR